LSPLSALAFSLQINTVLSLWENRIALLGIETPSRNLPKIDEVMLMC
jgi:hypothetical protein